jgi:hypothetical protein
MAASRDAVQSAEVTAAEQQAALGGEREGAERLKRDLMASRSRRDRSARNMTSLSILAP